MSETDSAITSSSDICDTLFATKVKSPDVKPETFADVSAGVTGEQTEKNASWRPGTLHYLRFLGKRKVIGQPVGQRRSRSSNPRFCCR